MSSTNRSGQAPHSPYDLVFGAAVFEEDRFPGIRAESEARGVPTEVPERFLLLGTVGSLLQELLPEGTGTEEFTRHGALLYQAYHFWRYGKEVFRLTEAEAREIVARPASPEAWHFEPPLRAGYLELPRHLFWARIEEGATPEPVAGFFWTVAEPVDAVSAQGRRLQLLLPLGLFPGRPGFSTIALDVRPDLLEATPPAQLAGEPGRADFENILPGGELQGWYGLLTELEVLKLVSRSFAEVGRRQPAPREATNE